MARPGKAPTSGPPEVLCPRGAQGFGNLPKDRPGLGVTTYTTSESFLHTNGPRQGAHGQGKTGKTGKMAKKISLQGKVREFENFI